MVSCFPVFGLITPLIYLRKPSGSHELGDTIQHFQLPPVAYRQLGAGAPLRMITDTSQPKIFDAFGRDERAPDRRTADKLGVHISTAEDAVVSLAC